jgi:hypothetical protein
MKGGKHKRVILIVTAEKTSNLLYFSLFVLCLFPSVTQKLSTKVREEDGLHTSGPTTNSEPVSLAISSYHPRRFHSFTTLQ